MRKHDIALECRQIGLVNPDTGELPKTGVHTVDCISAHGQFLGGVIAPGMRLGLLALQANTDQLPLAQADVTPPLIGDETSRAMQAGVYWITTQGINGLIDHMQLELASPCTIYGTGGGLAELRPNLHQQMQDVPHLVLSGMAMATS